MATAAGPRRSWVWLARPWATSCAATGWPPWSGAARPSRPALLSHPQDLAADSERFVAGQECHRGSELRRMRRQEAVDADLALDELVSQALGEGDHRPRRSPPRARGGRALGLGHRGEHSDDRCPRGHVLERLLDQVHGEAGVQAEHVDLTELGDHLLDQVATVVAIPPVDGKLEHAPAGVIESSVLPLLP